MCSLLTQNNQCEMTLEGEKTPGDEKMKHSEIKHYQTHVKHSYKCDQCDKAFGYKVVLKRHYMIHTDERPHKCDQCEKAFRLKSDLRRHTCYTRVRDHTNVTSVTNLSFKRHILITII